MAVKVELVPGAVGWEQMQVLNALVYTPEVQATFVGRDVQWAHAEKSALVRDGGTLLSHTGAYVRDGEWDGLPVKLGGIGAVVTHPEHRRQGHARTGLKAALTWLHDGPQVAFALLFAEPHNVPFYSHQGWTVFQGTVLVRQGATTAPFTLMHAMTLGIRQPAATRGTLDLRGEPW
jgi:aminoglycoside 2'-N-acetyltransferase I